MGGATRRCNRVVACACAIWAVAVARPALAQEARTVIEAQAKRELDRYLGIELPPPALRCTGESLHDCFGGEVACSVSENRPCSRAHLREERVQLLDALDDLAREAPRSDWLVGRQVDHAINFGHGDRAWAAAEECLGTLWWCQALRGYVLHHEGDAAAEFVFDSALANAPAGEPAWVEPSSTRMNQRAVACEWRDIALLLAGDLRERYTSDPCGENISFEARFWWLADPLWIVPGNERRAEHLARIVMMRLHDEAGGRDRGVHTREHHDAVIAAGPPNSWRGWIEYDLEGQPLERRSSFVDGGYGFAPDQRRFDQPLTSDAEDWAVDWGSGFERMATSDRWPSVENHQEVVLLRGDSASYLVAARAPRLLASLDGFRTALALGRPDDLTVHVFEGTIDPSGAIRVRATLVAANRLLSLEMLGHKWRGRVRRGAPAPELVGGFGVSEPLLVDSAYAPGDHDLLAAMFPSTLVRNTSIGLYFEAYGVDEQEPLRVRVSVQRVGRSFLSRLGGALGLSAGTEMSLSWEEPARWMDGRVFGRALALDLGPVPSGRYVIQLELERGNGQKATSRREISIRVS